MFGFLDGRGRLLLKARGAKVCLGWCGKLLWVVRVPGPHDYPSDEEVVEW